MGYTRLPEGHDPTGVTPLILAVKKGMDAIVNFLLSMGAKVNDANRIGETALFFASRNGDLQSLEILIKAGADIKFKNNEMKTAAMFAKDNETRLFITDLFKALNSSLRLKLNEFENAREVLLKKQYASEKEAEKSAKEILEITLAAYANNARFCRENIDKLPINLKDLRNVLFDWADLLTILNSKELSPSEQEKFDSAARANRELAAMLGHADAKRIVERYRAITASPDEKNKSADEISTDDIADKSNINLLASSPCLFSSEHKHAKQDQPIDLEEKNDFSVNLT
jgi:hypothetical protein